MTSDNNTLPDTSPAAVLAMTRNLRTNGYELAARMMEAMGAAPASPVSTVEQGETLAEARAGRLPTMNQEEYPGLGAWWVQIRIGPDFDKVLARVYGESPEETMERAKAVAAALRRPAPAAGDALDAARYRWLRDESLGVPDGMREIYVIQQRLPHTEGTDTELFDTALDAAVDAAIAQRKGDA
ncbi:hypothetical protein [Achromobacter ruhlandii]|uniref:hypothetical protein n=1 Tax=Achromobacter ruhlandii TaxID=72557 RepID=UPI003BA189FC